MRAEVRDAREVQGPPAARSEWGWLFWVAVAWCGALVLGAILAPWLPLHDPNDIEISERLASPSLSSKPLGTDELGRDLLSRAVYGARVSLGVSVGAVALGSVVGVTIGLFVGYVRGWAERIVMPVVDVLLAFPALVLVLALVAILGPNMLGLIVVLGLLAVPSTIRITRAGTLSAVKRGWVLAARAEGAGTGRVLFKEVLPTVAPPLVALALLGVGVYVVVEGGLSYLGLSVQPPTPTWGGMILDSQTTLRESLWPLLVPSLAMFFTVLAINYIGDVLRARLDVREASL